VSLLDRRTVDLEAKFAAHDTVVESLIKQGHPRVDVIEVAFLNSRLRSELDFVRALSEDIKKRPVDWRPPNGGDGEK
jgi:hypothetical protein